jgi:hypothetical protein
MKNKVRRSIFSLLTEAFFLLIAGSTAFAISPKDVPEPQPPLITDTGVLFSYGNAAGTDAGAPKYVKIIGDFNGWEESYFMTKNRYGVFVFLYSEAGKKGVVLPEGRYHYRFLVDGIWTNDPSHKRLEYDAGGTPLSYFDVPAPIVIAKKNPVYTGHHTYVFYYKNAAAKNVFLLGDFNDWNPYSLPMRQNASGLWEGEADILPGSYTYVFLVDGVYIRDPLGTDIVCDRFDNEYSRLTLP